MSSRLTAIIKVRKRLLMVISGEFSSRSMQILLKVVNRLRRFHAESALEFGGGRRRHAKHTCVHIRAPEEVGLLVHLLDRKFACNDVLAYPLMAGGEAPRMSAHGDPVCFSISTTT